MRINPERLPASDKARLALLRSWCLAWTEGRARGFMSAAAVAIESGEDSSVSTRFLLKALTHEPKRLKLISASVVGAVLQVARRAPAKVLLPLSPAIAQLLLSPSAPVALEACEVLAAKAALSGEAARTLVSFIMNLWVVRELDGLEGDLDSFMERLVGGQLAVLVKQLSKAGAREDAARLARLIAIETPAPKTPAEFAARALAHPAKKLKVPSGTLQFVDTTDLSDSSHVVLAVEAHGVVHTHVVPGTAVFAWGKPTSWEPIEEDSRTGLVAGDRSFIEAVGQDEEAGEEVRGGFGDEGSRLVAHELGLPRGVPDGLLVSASQRDFALLKGLDAKGKQVGVLVRWESMESMWPACAAPSPVEVPTRSVKVIRQYPPTLPMLRIAAEGLELPAGKPSTRIKLELPPGTWAGIDVLATMFGVSEGRVVAALSALRQEDESSDEVDFGLLGALLKEGGLA